jgi:hypothetical protein
MQSRDIIERQVAHMARLVDDLLDVSRLSQGKITCNALAWCWTRYSTWPSRPRSRSSATRSPPDGSSCPAAVTPHADLARLSQVFANLLNNAAKYAPPGGSIVVDVVEDASHVNVRVSDTGEGIAADHLERVFDLFAQAAGGSPTGAGGLGIGLALARRLVELHGGSLTASSPGVGRGATFTVRLPTVDTSFQATRFNESLEAEIKGLDRRVLVVDDNVDAADTAAMLLHASGCDVWTACGEQALREAALRSPGSTHTWSNQSILMFSCASSRTPSASRADRCRRYTSLRIR